MPSSVVAAEAQPPPKRSKFTFERCPKPSATNILPPDLNKLSREVKALPAPQSVRDRFSGPPSFVGIDIETHALVPNATAPGWRTDEFGLLTQASDDALSYLRLVQLGWACPGTGAAVVKSRLIKPEGFTIEKEATDKHKISHASACAGGVVAREALLEFFKDVSAAVGKGHRLVAHHLGFDAGAFILTPQCNHVVSLFHGLGEPVSSRQA